MRALLPLRLQYLLQHLVHLTKGARPTKPSNLPPIKLLRRLHPTPVPLSPHHPLLTLVREKPVRMDTMSYRLEALEVQVSNRRSRRRKKRRSLSLRTVTVIGNEFYDIQHYFGFSCMNTMTMFMHKRTDFFSLFVYIYNCTKTRSSLRSS